jgi:hypothetical protein
MASNDAKVENLGYVKLVDPNPPGRDVPPTEDLFIYVSLKAYSKSRSVILNEGEDNSVTTENSVQNNEVNFIATKLDTNSNDNISYATTDYTDIGGLNLEQNQNGTIEGFGIKNIDISYNSSLVPVVKITFEDIRGASLFDVVDRNNRKSPYSLFFKLPYPTFNLTVKGYYGRPVSYCLHMINWTSSFNSDSGNFEINADFIGFQSAFISDINMQHVIGVMETEAAQSKLSGSTIDGAPTPTLRDFLGDISKIQIGINDIKVGNDGFEKLKNINTSFSLIKTLSNIIGKPLPIVNERKNGDKLLTEIFRSPNFKTNDNIISIRDIIIIKESDKGYFNTFIESTNKVKKEYDKFQSESKIGDEYVIEEYLFDETDPNEVSLSKSSNTFSGFTEDLYEMGTTVWNICTDNSDFDITNISGYETKEKFLEKYKNTFPPNTGVLVYDFSKMRDDINEIEINLKKKVKEEKEKLSKEINDELKEDLEFNPTIRNSFSIIMNNVQAMLEALYDVSLSAEGDAKERYSQLTTVDKTDINDSEYVYPWPAVYQNNEKGELKKQVWLETVVNDTSLFPEIKFVNDAIDGYIKSSKELRQYRKVVRDINNPNSPDNWLSINVMDYKTNPYFEFNSPDKWQSNKLTDGVPNELYGNIIERAITLKSLSNTISQNSYNTSYPYLEGSIATTNLISQEYLDVVGNNFTVDNAISSAEKEGIIKESGGNYILEKDPFDDKIYFKVGEKVRPILKNRSSLSIRKDETDDIISKFDSLKPKNTDVSKGIFYQSKFYLYKHNISYLVWDEVTRNNITKPTSYDLSYRLKIDKLSDINGLGKLNGSNILESTIYKNESDLEKSTLLILDTFPFLSFDETLKQYVYGAKQQEQKVSKVIELPKLYIAWLGGTLKYNPSNVKTSLNEETKEHLIDYFDKWYSTDGNRFNEKFDTYSANPNDEKKNKNFLSLIKDTDDMGIVTPFKLKDNGELNEISIPKTQLKNYLDVFKKGFNDNLNKIKESKNQKQSENTDESFKNNDLKLAFYNYFKLIYDKWMGGSGDGKIFNACGANQGNLIDYFKFLNRAWGDIGDKAVCNLNSLVTLSDDITVDLYTYISKILRDSNFLLQILPTYIDFNNAEKAKEIFKPFTDFDSEINSSPVYACFLANGQSKTLELDSDDRRYYYTNDGFVFEDGKMPAEFNNDDVNESLVAFRVAFGTENQSFFKGVSLNQQEHKATAEYYKQLSNLVDKRSGVDRVLQGNDLYDLFSTRSYKCTVNGLGNMNLQPLMYFQLDNVPFFRGAYLIMGVEHSITPNNMTTSFTGLRQSVNTIPVVDTATTFLNIDFSEVDEVATRLNVSNLVNEQDVLNTDFKVDDPEGTIALSLINATSLSNLGVTGSDEYRSTLATALTTYMPRYDVDNNTEVCNFLAQCLHESGKFNIVIEGWTDPNLNSEGVAQNGSTAQKNYENNIALGNTQTGDGYRFKGRGYIQVTGRANYKVLQDKGGELFEGIATKYNDVNGWKKIDDLFNIKATEPSQQKLAIERSVIASLIWWRDSAKIGKLTEGTVSESQSVSRKVNRYQKDDILNKRTQLFEDVLDVFNLKTFYDGQ